MGKVHKAIVIKTRDVKIWENNYQSNKNHDNRNENEKVIDLIKKRVW